MLNKIFFVVGSPRSGSSLIYNAFCSKKIFNPAIPESHLVTNLTKLFYKQINRNNSFEKQYFFENIEDTKSYFKNCINIFFKKIAKKYKSEFLILKSITITENINVLYELYPEISYIMTIRDPRDIIVSMINVGKKQEEINALNQFPRNIELLCNKINSSYRFYLDSNYTKFLEKKVSTIKYEDFVLNTSDTLNNITNNIAPNITYDQNFNLWQRSSDNYTEIESKSKNPYRSDLWNKPIKKERIGIYKDVLTNNEINQINILCKKLINLFNY